MSKIFVEVNVHYNLNGKMTPLSITWEDGRVFEIDKVMDYRRAASLKAGGQGLRFICIIRSKEIYLFYDEPVWFIEGRN